MKEYTYSIIGKDPSSGRNVEMNCANPTTKFSRKSRFSTEAAARKGLERDLHICHLYGVEVTSWTLYSETSGIIETNEDNDLVVL